VFVLVFHREHDNGGVDAGLSSLPKHLEPVFLRELHVQEHNIVWWESRELLQCIFAIGRESDLVTLAGKEVFQTSPDLGIVLGDEESGLGGLCRGEVRQRHT
jgi:hypothetical protein